MRDILASLSDEAKRNIDLVSVTATVGALVQWLPSIAALLSIVWTAIRIMETETVRRGLAKLPYALAWLTGIATKAAGLIVALKGVLALLKRKPPQ